MVKESKYALRQAGEGFLILADPNFGGSMVLLPLKKQIIHS